MVPQRVPTPIPSPGVLTPIDLDALETEGAGSGPTTDICKVCHIQHERPVFFYELISGSSSSSSDTENPNGVQELSVVEEVSDLDSMPELEYETNLDSIEIRSFTTSI